MVIMTLQVTNLVDKVMTDVVVSLGVKELVKYVDFVVIVCSTGGLQRNKRFV